jgi:hypothetical protein
VFSILKFALKLDLFKEPSFKISKSKIVEKGTITGLLFTVIFIISMSMCLWFVVAFYDSYTPFFAVADSGCPAVNAESPLGSNNDNTISVETNDGDESEYMPILACLYITFPSSTLPELSTDLRCSYEKVFNLHG